MFGFEIIAVNLLFSTSYNLFEHIFAPAPNYPEQFQRDGFSAQRSAILESVKILQKLIFLVLVQSIENLHWLQVTHVRRYRLFWPSTMYEPSFICVLSIHSSSSAVFMISIVAIFEFKVQFNTNSLLRFSVISCNKKMQRKQKRHLWTNKCCSRTKVSFR